MVSEKKLSHLKPENIHKNPENPRIIFREEDLDVLMRSIASVGIQVPLSVYKKSNTNKYLLIDGERRWRCALKLGLETVPVIIEPEPSPLNNLLMMFNIHNVRVQWDLMALAVKLVRVKDLFFKEQKVELTRTELSDITGVSSATISRCDELLNLPSKYQNIIWRELEKPKGEQKYTEDLFLEIRKSIKAIENYQPEIIKRYNPSKLLDIFFNKYKAEIVTNRVAFRDISKIARAERVGISKQKVIPILLKFIEDENYTIDQAYEESVADAYLERDYGRKISDVIDLMKNIDPIAIDEDIFGLIEELKDVIDRFISKR